MSGDYRKILVKPKDLKYEIVSYENHSTTSLIKSDLDVLTNTQENGSIEESQQTGQRFKAVVIEFSLPTSSYATVLMREVMREIGDV